MQGNLIRTQGGISTINTFLMWVLFSLCSFAVSGQGISDEKHKIDSFWVELISATCSENINALNKLCTVEGLSSLVGYGGLEQQQKKRVSFCQTFRGTRIKIKSIDRDEAFLQLGDEDVENGIYAGAVVLKCIRKKWLLEKYLPAK